MEVHLTNSVNKTCQHWDNLYRLHVHIEFKNSFSVQNRNKHILLFICLPIFARLYSVIFLVSLFLWQNA